MNYFKFGRTVSQKAAQKRRRAARSESWRRELAKAKQEIKQGEKVV